MKTFSDASPDRTVEYAHRDDYYVFGLLTCGSCRVSIDFLEYDLKAGDAVCVAPYQVHRILAGQGAEGKVLFMDAVFFDAPARRLLEGYAARPRPLGLDAAQYAEMDALFQAVSRRINRSARRYEDKALLQHLARAATGIVMEAMQDIIYEQAGGGRRLEIVASLRQLLHEEPLAVGKTTSYANRLHLSPAYLNEVVKGVTGMSVSRYIRSEHMLRAKRLLVYTRLSIKEVASQLGYEDAAYFTRLFTKETGVSPTAFRGKYLESSNASPVLSM